MRTLVVACLVAVALGLTADTAHAQNNSVNWTWRTEMGPNGPVVSPTFTAGANGTKFLSVAQGTLVLGNVNESVTLAEFKCYESAGQNAWNANPSISRKTTDAGCTATDNGNGNWTLTFTAGAPPTTIPGGQTVKVEIEVTLELNTMGTKTTRKVVVGTKTVGI